MGYVKTAKIYLNMRKLDEINVPLISMVKRSLFAITAKSIVMLSPTALRLEKLCALVDLELFSLIQSYRLDI